MTVNADVAQAQNPIKSAAQEIEENRENWDDRAEVHFNGGYGDIDALINGSPLANPIVRRDYEVLKPYLPNHSVEGQRLLHLQCHIGTDTVCWARLGAKDVCGLDFSPASLRYARQIAQQAGVDITYVEADARKAAEALPGKQFDVIVTSVGTVTWLPSLEGWAQSIAELLAPNGVFMIRDNHPLLFALADNGLSIGNSYFPGTEDSYDTESTYTMAPQTENSDDTDSGTPDNESSNRTDSENCVGDERDTSKKPKITHIHNHNWAHDFDEMTRVLIDAGLRIERIGEYDVSDWQSLPMLEYDKQDESWRMPQGYPRIPLTFSIVARKA
ncbi:methyltransferase domain-containing protein [Bifidobacterium sp. ESL0764]|uniref:class I SAM-dependent methyltransferase n=1 Tax=Bifidobacterium sp. ESL0764 TaxID=2983228 RepID=UPI0023F6DEFC|nr:methyltransferase domain-containing protein [Bifidobacterium sp. ESL0764]WEV65176.1 methyltransferase domain-containing protein [Bifidobacterium sp. ESL0764]